MKRNIEGSAKFESKLFKSNISAVVYCRISSKEQSLDMQEMKCIEYAKENGYNVIKIVKEISSARSFSKLNNLKSLIKSISDVNIIVYSIDRFCRNTMDMLNVMTVLEANNINMVSVVDHINMSTAAGRHAFRQRVSAAELESDLIAERVNRSVEYKKSLGHIFGVAPYGYSKKIEVINNQKICKELQENSEEQKIIRIIKKISNTKLSPNEVTAIISTELNMQIDNVEIYEETEDGRETKIQDNVKVIIEYQTVCDILNSYYLYKRNKLWGVNEVKKYTSYSMKTLRSSLIDSSEIMDEYLNDESDDMLVDSD